MSNKLPDGFQVRSRKEWEELLASPDTTKRGLVNQALRALGLAPGSYLKLGDAEKVEYIVKRQAEAGGGGDDEKPASTKGKVGEAAKAAPAAASSTASAAGAGGGASSKQLADIQAQLVELGKEVIAMKKLIMDIHYLARIETLANAELNTNAEDAGIREEFYGKPLEGNG